jgi:hypothetical protein
MAISFPLTIIGTVDIIDLPDFELQDVACKIDTGADTSTIHCSDIHLTEKEEGKVLCFKVLDHKHDAWHGKWLTYKNYKVKTIRSSFGDAEERYSIQTKVNMFGRVYPIEFTLSDRKKMKYPMLLGRKFLKQHFLVDVNQKNLSYKAKINQSK